MSSQVSLKPRRGTSFKVTFPTAPSFRASPQRVYLVQEPGKHDILTLAFTKASAAWFKVLKTGTPVQFTWKQGPHSRTWIGYVNQVVNTTIAQRETPFEVVCLGASFVLKQKSREVFKNKTVPEVAHLIAKKFKLQFDGVQHPRRFAHIGINGQSYWSWLQEYSRKIGYVCYVDGVRLVFKPFDKEINSSFKSAPVFSFIAGGTPVNNMYMDRTLDSLTVYNGDYNEGGEANRTTKTANGIDPVTGKLLTAFSTPKDAGEPLRASTKGVIFDEFSITQVVNSFVEVETAAKGAAQLARFNVPAKAVGQGDPRVHPYSPIQINGTGNATDGAWIALKVQHMLHRVGDYQIEMGIASDGLGPNAQTQFRQSSPSLTGIINLDEMLLATNSEVEVYPSLDNKYLQLYDGDYGFANNPTTWRAKRYTGQGCCP